MSPTWYLSCQWSCFRKRDDASELHLLRANACTSTRRWPAIPYPAPHNRSLALPTATLPFTLALPTRKLAKVGRVYPAKPSTPATSTRDATSTVTMTVNTYLDIAGCVSFIPLDEPHMHIPPLLSRIPASLAPNPSLLSRRRRYHCSDHLSNEEPASIS
ncbi:hypothetical protein BDM02DRAFT_464681 [Thelephora ganbajun]|uniref:Uncharacterized protein n=1 Tax=Thelephora ganbajun TaxID=370292 RepID=A0ACB6ZRD4_THEGA|nr:hypothetical protein BDM02DRAFT_464681 [Thelephora ganbajun]